jgi:hypothetical protein
VHRVEHGDNVCNRRGGLHIMNGVENESAARREDFAAAQHLFAHLRGRSEGQNLLRVHAPAPEHDAVAELGLQVFGLHARGRALHGIENVESRLNERRNEF